MGTVADCRGRARSRRALPPQLASTVPASRAGVPRPSGPTSYPVRTEKDRTLSGPAPVSHRPEAQPKMSAVIPAYQPTDSSYVALRMPASSPTSLMKLFTEAIFSPFDS